MAFAEELGDSGVLVAVGFEDGRGVGEVWLEEEGGVRVGPFTTGEAEVSSLASSERSFC